MYYMVKKSESSKPNVGDGSYQEKEQYIARSRKGCVVHGQISGRKATSEYGGVLRSFCRHERRYVCNTSHLEAVVERHPSRHPSGQTGDRLVISHHLEGRACFRTEPERISRGEFKARGLGKKKYKTKIIA